jgi:hypothetical protein
MSIVRSKMNDSTAAVTTPAPNKTAMPSNCQKTLISAFWKAKVE